MKGISNFVLGFSLSLFGMYITGQPHSSEAQSEEFPLQRLNIELFKPSIDSIKLNYTDANIKKETISIPPQESPLVEDNTTSTQEVAFSQYIEGVDDDEILSININGDIPIDVDNFEYSNAEILYNGDDTQVATLPLQIEDNSDDIFPNNDAWVVAKGSKNIKNKKILEKYDAIPQKSILRDEFQEISAADEDFSYKVADKIKQSIIFPIPDEILNDENLTPTFIKANSKAKTASAPKNKSPIKKEVSTPKKEVTNDNFKIIPKASPNQENTEEESSGLLSSISSWFSDKITPSDIDKEADKTSKTKHAPSYSSQGAQKPSTHPNSEINNNRNDFANFYETLQETKDEYTRKNIIPTELKLSFQPGRAEISGQTLRWLKAFSDTAKEKNTYLQVRIDATAPIELQRKRLNLLYTIFMNNGLDSKKVDTVFSLTEPNAFIIRTLKLK